MRIRKVVIIQNVYTYENIYILCYIYIYVLFPRNPIFIKLHFPLTPFAGGLSKYQNQFRPHVQAISARSWTHFWKALTKSLSSLRARDPLAPLMLGHLLTEGSPVAKEMLSRDMLGDVLG